MFKYISIQQFLYPYSSIYSKKYAHDSRFVVIYCGLVMVDVTQSTQIAQSIGSIYNRSQSNALCYLGIHSGLLHVTALVSVNQTWRIGVNVSCSNRKNWWYPQHNKARHSVCDIANLLGHILKATLDQILTISFISTRREIASGPLS